jgi:ketosteroid isomerase-like protein
VICLEVDPRPSLPADLTDRRAEVTIHDVIRAAIEAHVAAVGAADVGALAALYAPDGRLYDPAGSQPVVGRAAIAGHFAKVLSEPRDVHIVTIAVSGLEAAGTFEPRHQLAMSVTSLTP